MNNKALVYVACPYRGKTENETEQNFEIFLQVDAHLTREGYFTVSPLLKNLVCMTGDLPQTWDYWKEYSKVLMSRCDYLIVVMLEGWSTSEGINGEIALANELSIPIHYFDLQEIE